ncbi:MAG: DUF4395 domain-containing protein [Epsilonproteobacteria bacterium]|nr:DUF4395 domain-containing protein [Campylobacterota bacterium]
MAQSCPISQKRVDANVVRFIATLTAATALLFLLTDHSFFILLLLFDFSVRLFRKQKLSPFCFLSTTILQVLPVKPKLCDEAPKRFALVMGWVMLILIAAFILFSLHTLAFVLTLILFVCATLEALFEFCVGCKIYQILNHFQRK